MTNLIGFTGLAQSGKSTASDYVAKKIGAHRLNFKNELVAEIKENFPSLFSLLLEIYYSEGKGIITIDDLFIHKPPLVRSLMQNYGTDVRRGDNPNYWVKKWMNTYAALHPEPVVVDDVRFINEAEQIKSLKGIIIRIERTDIENGGTHSSETEQDQITPDHTITVKKGELDKLYQELDKIV